MGFFFHHKRGKKDARLTDEVLSSEVDELKHPMHESVDKASKDIRRFNELLMANGITLNISIATGGHRHAR